MSLRESTTHHLCYIDEYWAYFTSCPLNKQCADDWGDHYYEWNAGPPYEWKDTREVPPYTILKLAFDGDWRRPCDVRDSFSVDEINAGAVPWLSGYEDSKPIVIPAGTSVAEFCARIRQGGGMVYGPLWNETEELAGA